MRRFLLISDIHAVDVDPLTWNAPSYVSSYRPPTGATVDPISELEKLIQQESLSPDCILCPGDITNKSKPAPFSYAWKRLNELATSLGKPLIATVGNHDVDSRYASNSHDPRGFAMSLDPNIPAGERIRFLEYWAENFTVFSTAQCNIIVLNTAAYHGYGADTKKELLHGRISDATLAKIKTTLSGLPNAPVNILLCHHHLLKPELADDELSGQTRGGDKIIQLLNESDAAWVVVHGHKHIPDLFYGHGGLNAPVVFACASFSAQINEDAQNKHPNQVHLLVCDPETAEAQGMSSSGQILSWTWAPGVGWSRSSGPHGLPYVTGFAIDPA